MWNLYSISLILILYSANAELDDGTYLSSAVPQPSSTFKRGASSENGNSGNPIANYAPSGIKHPFDIQAIQKCYETALVYFQESGYIPGTGGQNGTRGQENSSYNFSSMMQNEQFKAIFEKCMEGDKHSSSRYKKREADSGSNNPFGNYGNYFSSGFKPPFSMDKWKKCSEEAWKVMQGYAGGGSRGGDDKEEEGSISQSQQFQAIFEKCMEGDKPSSSRYKKRGVDSGSNNPFGNYIPSGFNPPFSMDKWKKCSEEAWKVMQGYASGGSRGGDDKEEEGSISQSQQFQAIFEKCMEGDKQSSSRYKKREADSGSNNPLGNYGNYFSSGFKPPFSMDKWKKCSEEAWKVMQGYASGGSRGGDDKEEEGSISQSQQFQAIFEKCMEGDKPSSSRYKKRGADSGSNNPFGNYIPSGFNPPFSMDKWKKCSEEAWKVMQGYASGGSRGGDDKEEEGSISQSQQFQAIFEKCMEGDKQSSSRYKKREADSGSNNPFGNYGNYFSSGFKPPFSMDKWKKCSEEAWKVMQGYASGGSRGGDDKEEEGSISQSQQFQAIFEKCMEGDKPSSSRYKKREVDSGSNNPFGNYGNYIPSGFNPPFSMDKWKKCSEEAWKVMQGYASGGSRGGDDKEEEGSISQSQQFQAIFEKCMEGDKPSSSRYKKRGADSGSNNPFGNYIPSGFNPPFSMDKWKKCSEEAWKVMQGYASGGSRGGDDKEEEGSINQSQQFQAIFEKCMEGDKQSSSRYKKREADSGSNNPLGNYGNYFSSGFKPPFSMDKWKKCSEEAWKVMQGYASGGSRGGDDKEEEGSISQSQQFQAIFEKCMEGDKPSSSRYKKRGADSGSNNPFGNYIPSGFNPPFSMDKWKKCSEEAWKVMQGYASGGSRGGDDKEEEGSISQSQQFQAIFEKCMEGDKPSSSRYKKRGADSGSNNPFGNYIPSGFNPPFSMDKWKKCSEEAWKVMQGYASGGSRGGDDKEEEGSISQSQQFQAIFEKCMEGDKPSSSRYKKREVDSGSNNPFGNYGNYIPSGFNPPFSMDKWKKCSEEAWKVMQGYASGGSRGGDDKEEEGSINQSQQFQAIFEKCMEGDKPSSSRYKKRGADSGSNNPFGNYIPSGFNPPFSMDKWKKCSEEAWKVMQGYASGGSRGGEEGSISQSQQFQAIFEKCMEGDKPSSSRYKKREVNLMQRIKKSACNSDNTERNKVLRHISMFY